MSIQVCGLQFPCCQNVSTADYDFYIKSSVVNPLTTTLGNYTNNPRQMLLSLWLLYKNYIN